MNAVSRRWGDVAEPGSLVRPKRLRQPNWRWFPPRVTCLLTALTKLTETVLKKRGKHSVKPARLDGVFSTLFQDCFRQLCQSRQETRNAWWEPPPVWLS